MNRPGPMRVTLVGTGTDDGWPVPSCPCASCQWARSAGLGRRPTAILVDGLPLYGVRAPASRGVRELPGGGPDEVLYDLGGRLLYARGAGRLPGQTVAVVSGAAYQVVLLDVAAMPLLLAELRRYGAVTDRTRIIAVHLGHRAPVGPELHRRLALWGAEALPDGTVVDAPSPAPERPGAPRRVLVLGGARSGKSAEAERRLAAEPEVTYVATGLVAGDPEWLRRVAVHRERRPSWWRTLETTDLVPLLRDPPGPLLVDCLTLWLAAFLDEPAAADELVDAWRDTTAYAVAVSNEVGSGIVPATESGRRFRDALGTLNAGVASVSDEVWLVTAGIARRLA